MNAPPIPQERVLPTLNQDGTRRRIRLKLYEGPHHTRRRILGWGLIALFVGLPFVRISGEPAVLLNVAEREFVLGGRTFLATDGVLLMLLMLAIFVGIIFLTALLGRAWCGWGCPQTVYMEFLFRPIERLFEGDRNSQLRLDQKGGGARRILKNVTFAVLSVLVANVFLAYFVGTDMLLQWVTSAPSEHPGGFLVMGVTAGLVFFDFAYFREQMCTVICPYARLQAALLDKNSLIIGYDEKRGEPRHKGKYVPGVGDCIDCSACVVTCPTGIDIREGLQLECIACGQCIDACNTIMAKVDKPLGLIRYASQNSLDAKRTQLLRPRVLVYAVLLVGLVGALVLVGGERMGADVTVLRGIGAPFALQGDLVRNQVRVKIENRRREAEIYDIAVLVGEGDALRNTEELGIVVVNPENPLEVPGNDRRTTSLFVSSGREAFQDGRIPIVVRVTSPDGTSRDEPFVLLGPSAAP